jgi:hypothetical protein
VRSKQRLVPPSNGDGSPRWPRLPQLRALPAIAIDERLWRNAAAERVLQTWGAFLATEEGKKDPGVASIRGVVDVLQSVAAQRQSTGALV